MMRYALPFLLITFLIACSTLNTPLPPSPEAASVTSTFASIPPASTATTSSISFPNASAYHWTPIVSGLNSPVDIQFPNDGTNRMFIIEQVGRIRIIANGQLIEKPFLDITDQVGSEGNEQGLLGLAFHPNYKDNGFFYVNFTSKGDGNTVIARFHADGNIVDLNSEQQLLHVTQPFENHNGGEMTFGPDGYLYTGLGDGGNAGDPFGNGQNTNSLLGKILRIDINNGLPYAIPSGNPFANGGGRPEIWQYGLRNPWRFSFDKATGDLYIADVGQDTWEEIDHVAAGQGGLNFGWNYREGNHPFAGNPSDTLKLINPVVEYNHAEGGCSITGGYVYRGAMTEWNGIYFYGDFCTGKIWGLIHSRNGWQSQVLFETGFNITSFGQDSSGEIYLADRGGIIYKFGK